MSTNEKKPPAHRSVSQRNTFDRCGYRYYLERIEKVWQRPASWLSQGLGVHVAMEAWERSGRTLSMDELVGIYREEFIRSIEEQSEHTPNFDYWFGSGPYDGPTDIERRFGIGEDQLRALVQYSLDHPEKVWTTPDGDQAIELEFNVELGGVPVKGFIDQVVDHPDDGLIVRDIKTGAKPGDIFQLATYAEAMRILYDETPEHGDYFMGKTGKPTKLLPITPKDREFVHEEFARVDAAIRAGEFEPIPDPNNCRMCAVRAACEFAM